MNIDLIINASYFVVAVLFSAWRLGFGPSLAVLSLGGAAVLADAPQGAALPLTCAWSAPDGGVRYQNRWETKTIDRDRFPTHCRHTFGAGDAAGPDRVGPGRRGGRSFPL